MSRSNSTKRRRHQPEHNPVVICEPAGRKVRHSSRKRALTAMNNPARGASTTAQSVYRCRHCGGWHLTKRPPA